MLHVSRFMQDRWCVEAEIDSDVCRCWSYFFFTSVWPEARTSSWPCCHCWTKTANRSLLRGLRISAVHLDFIGVQFSQQNAVMKCLFVRCCFVGHVRVVLCCFSVAASFQFIFNGREGRGRTEAVLKAESLATLVQKNPSVFSCTTASWPIRSDFFHNQYNSM